MSVQPTPSQTVGPFYSIGCCRRDESRLVDPGDPDALALVGKLLDGAGEPITDGLIEVWDPVGTRWGRSGTEDQGRFSFAVAKPAPRPGDAPHLEVLVLARGLLKHQWTRLYFQDEIEANRRDPVLAALSPDERATLVAETDGRGLRFDIHLQGDQETVFFTI